MSTPMRPVIVYIPGQERWRVPARFQSHADALAYGAARIGAAHQRPDGPELLAVARAVDRWARAHYRWCITPIPSTARREDDRYQAARAVIDAHALTDTWWDPAT